MGVRGKKYDLTLRSDDCSVDLGTKEDVKTNPKTNQSGQNSGESKAETQTNSERAQALQKSTNQPESDGTNDNQAKDQQGSKKQTSTQTTKWKVKPPEGSGVHGAEPTGSGKCFLIVPVTIDDAAPIGTVLLDVYSSDGQENLVKFEIVGAVPGPTPPGLSPQVDVMWGVLPRRIVRDNFGHFISDKYYAIQVIMGNNSGYSLQIAGVGFCLALECPSNDKLLSNGSISPTSSYRITRGTLDKGRQVGNRNTTLHIIQALGPLATGFSVFFRNTSHRATYSSGVDIFSNPFEKGFDIVWPDTTIQQLFRLDDQMLRDGLIVPNNTQVRTLVFFPKESLARFLRKNPGTADKQTWKAPDLPDSCSSFPDSVNPFRHTPAKCAGKANLDDVMHALGKLVLIGDTIQYLNRVRVEANPPGPVVPPPSDLKIKYVDKQPTSDSVKNGTDEDGTALKISITGRNLKDATVSIPDSDNTVLSIKPETVKVVSDTQIDVTISVSKGAASGKYPIGVANSGGTETVDFEVLPAEKASPGSGLRIKYTDPPQATADSVKKDGAVVGVSITGKNLKDAKVSFPESDIKVLAVKAGTTPVVTDTQIDMKISVTRGTKEGEYPIQIGAETVGFVVARGTASEGQQTGKAPNKAANKKDKNNSGAAEKPK